MERDILLDNFALLIVRQAIPFPLVGECPKPPKNPDGCFRLPSKVRQTLRRSAQKKCRRQYRMIPPAFFFSDGDSSLYILRNAKNQFGSFCTIFCWFMRHKTIHIDNFIVV